MYHSIQELTQIFIHSQTDPAKVITFILAKQEMLAQSPSREDPLEKEMATHSSILTRKIPWTEHSGELLSMALQKS